jgi:hypothetical protein
MMGDTTIKPETREKVRKLCTETRIKDVSGDLETEEAAEQFMEDVRRRMREQVPDTI